jgi:hypothetical protein
MPGNIDSIRIRMYNTGSVGDCFLLLFQKNGVTSFTMMIDCGGIKTSSALVTPAVQDILNTTNGKIDLLLGTHQHEDHLSGFNLARAVFDQIKVDEVWMSWIEDATDPLAKLVKKKYGKKLQELRATMQKWATGEAGLVSTGSGEAMSARRKNINQKIKQSLELLEFEKGGEHAKGLAVGSRTNDDAMKYLKKKGKKMVYRQPGEIVKMPNAEGIKFYVLGPPRDSDLKFLKIEMDEDEMYHLALTSADEPAEEPAITLADVETMLVENQSPFSKEYLLAGAELKTFNKMYNNRDLKWRQIEDDWKDAANDMALALTRLVNNTSLAIALEFEDSGAVVLLPADAQSGNWMSWHKPEVINSFKKKGGKVTSELLKNTVFYKVGHHSSHNGTASIHGLEMMSSKDLVAFIPLVQNKIPAAWGGAKNFPAAKLYPKIVEKAKGRVVRTDKGLINDGGADTERSKLSAADKKAFVNNFKTGATYFEYVVRE